MSDQTIFGNTNPDGNPITPGGTSTPPNALIDPAIATLLGDIKNERGEPKYKSLHDALVALQHSQTYIPQLTTQIAARDQELVDARAAAARVAELERSVLELTQRSTPPASTTPAGLTEEQVAELVTRSLTAREQETIATQNAAQVVASLRNAFGTEAETKYNAQAAEMGISVAELNALAAKSPKVVLKMFNVLAAAPVAPTHGTVNTAALQPHQDTFVGRNKKSMLIGATTADLNAEREASNKMVAELEAKGMSVYDLTDPKQYAKYFGS